MTKTQKKFIMWFTIFLIAIPMPFIIYFGIKFQDEKPAPVEPVNSSQSR